MLPDDEIDRVKERFKSYGPTAEGRAANENVRRRPPSARRRRAERRRGPFDLVVVGGGVNGAGIARDAAGRGLTVLLCEKDDLAQGTSSRSGKLIHGGLRYLEYYEFRLVREALIEREVLLRAAPHIIWPMRFVLPHVAGAAARPGWSALGLFLYDHLGGRKLLPATRALDLHRDPEGRPLQARVPHGFEYSDCWVDDARLVVLNALDAAERGAEILTRTALASAPARRRCGSVAARGPPTGQPRQVRRAALVNAAGPWVEQVLGRAVGVNSSRARPPGQGQPYRHAASSGTATQAYLLQNTDKRVIFVNPLRGRSGADRHDRHSGRGTARGRRDRRRTRPSTCCAVSPATSPQPPDAGDIVHSFCRRAAAL